MPLSPTSAGQRRRWTCECERPAQWRRAISFVDPEDTDGEAEDDSDESQVEQARALHKKKMLDDEAVQIALEDGRTVFASNIFLGFSSTSCAKLD